MVSQRLQDVYTHIKVYNKNAFKHIPRKVKMLIGILFSLDRAGWGKILARNNRALVEKISTKALCSKQRPNFGSFFGERILRDAQDDEHAQDVRSFGLGGLRINKI